MTATPETDTDAGAATGLGLGTPETLPNGKATYAAGGGVALITLTNPPANGYSYEMMRDLDEAVLRARFDDTVEVIVLAGAGEKFFCAGADIAMLDAVTPSFKYAFCLHANETLLRLEHTPKLVLAALGGHCVGGGLEIALACDLRIARKASGKTGLPEVALGVLPGTGGTQRLARVLGKSKAIELMAKGDLVAYEDALALGLVNELREAADDAAFLAQVVEIARSYTSPGKASLAVGAIKRSVQTGAELTLEAGLALERELQARLFASDDAREGIAAFTEKRRPTFPGELIVQAVHVPEHGGPEVLQLVDLPDPTPGAGEVLVRVRATSINHLDLWVRRGMPGLKLPLPMIPGCDGVGEVVEVGSGVDHVQPGQLVVIEPGYSSGTSAEDRAGNDHLARDYTIRGEHFDGLDRELVTLEGRFVFPLPEGVDPVLGAAVPLVFVTAWGMLVTRADLRAGETCLVLGGASGVGSAAIQVARDLGARVLTTAGTEAKRNLALELGAHAAFDHGDPDWPKAVRAATDGRGADVVVEHVGPATWAGSMRSLAHCGRLVTCGGTTGPKVEVMLPHLFIKQQSVLGSTMGPKNALPTIFDKVASGAYRPVVDRVMPLSAVREAHELLEARQVQGKIVLTPGA